MIVKQDDPRQNNGRAETFRLDQRAGGDQCAISELRQALNAALVGKEQVTEMVLACLLRAGISCSTICRGSAKRR